MGHNVFGPLRTPYNHLQKMLIIIFVTSWWNPSGAGLSTNLSQPRPAGILVLNWDRGKPAAFDISIVSPLNSNVLSAAGVIAGAASEAAELRKKSVQNWDRCPSLLWWRLMGHEARRLNSAAFPDLHLALLSVAVCLSTWQPLNSMQGF